MNTETQIQTKNPLKNLFEKEDVQKRFREMLGKKAPGFITSVLQIAASNDLLKDAEPSSILNAAAVAATLDLPLNNNLGFAYIVPYKQRDGKVVAQFQMGYKGFIQLAQRSGQFKNISVARIHDGQLVSQNPLTGFEFDFNKKKSDLIIGYAAYFSLINGFEKVHYMTTEELKAHGTKFSQSFKKGFGLWKDEFDAMAGKTVLKLLLSKFGPMSIEMQKAVVSDQGIIEDMDANEVKYVDNNPEPLQIDKESERLDMMIRAAGSVGELEMLKPEVHKRLDLIPAYDARMAELSGKLV